MQDYTYLCTEEQTKKAYRLGAPISKSMRYTDVIAHWAVDIGREFYLVIPTTQQMINWLREEKDFPINGLYYGCENEPQTYKEAELAAIDDALDNFLAKEE